MILSDWMKTKSAKLQAAGIDLPGQELGYFLSHFLQKDAAFILRHRDDDMMQIMDRTTLLALEAAIDRRAQREPAAYILGQAPFYRHVFQVGPGVLVPRFETELLVDLVLYLLGMTEKLFLRQTRGSTTTPLSIKRDRVLNLADIGCGSGCLGLSVSLALTQNKQPHKMVMTDISFQALQYAKKNARALGCQAATTIYLCDLFWPINEEEKMDIIMSNPPYICREQLDGLMPEVAKYEPRLALCGEKDGLSFYRKIIVGAATRLNEGGALVFEHAPDQAKAITDMLDAAGYDTRGSFADYGGHERITFAQKRA